MSSAIECVIFDLDGTLVDTHEANALAYAAAFDSLGMSLTQDEYAEYFGLGARDMLVRYCERHGLPFSPELLQACQDAKAVEYAKHLGRTKLLPTAAAILEAFAGVTPLALATTARRVNAEAVLAHHGLLTRFDCTIFGEDVVRTKPDPECHEKISRALGVRPERCLILEDSDTGVAAAKAFGGLILRVLD